MSWDLLKRFLESDVFNQNPFLSVSYLSCVLWETPAFPLAHRIADCVASSRYADHIGIHYVLCSKLRQFPYEDIEFFLPQLCHLIISVDNESMALEEFLLDLCEESVTAALLVRPPHTTPPYATAMANAHIRPSGSSKPTSTTSHRTPRPRPSRHVVGCTTRSNTLYLGFQRLYGTRESPRMCCRSRFWEASSSRASHAPCCRSGLDRWPLPRPGNHALSSRPSPNPPPLLPRIMSRLEHIPSPPAPPGQNVRRRGAA